MGAPAVFLDRDDTLMVDSGFVDHPDKVVLVPGAIEAVRRLNAIGYKVVVATNQSGVARGYFDEARLRQIHDRLRERLAAGDARVDGIYFCPYLDSPEASVEAYRCRSELRKPLPGMLLQAGREMDLDLGRSWIIGDSARDIEAGRAAGCRTILITNGNAASEAARVRPHHLVSSLVEAVAIVEQDAIGKARRDEGTEARRDEGTEAQRDGVVSPPGPPSADSVELLTEIRDLLDRQRRAELHDDFSIFRLLATLVQMLALVTAGWGFFSLFTDDSSGAVTRFVLAGFCQLIVISTLLADRR